MRCKSIVIERKKKHHNYVAILLPWQSFAVPQNKCIKEDRKNKETNLVIKEFSYCKIRCYNLFSEDCFKLNMDEGCLISWLWHTG